jgi:hypothetical protein
MLLVALSAMLLAPAAHAASVTLSPAAGLAGSTVTLQGSGFPARATVHLSAAGRRGSAKTSARGAFRATLTIPRRGREIRVRSRAGSRQVVNVYRVSAKAVPLERELARSGGERLRWTPADPAPGSSVALSGRGLPAAASVRIALVGASQASQAITLRTKSAGSLTARVPIPAAARAPLAISLHVGAQRLRLPLIVRSAHAPAPGANVGPGPPSPADSPTAGGTSPPPPNPGGSPQPPADVQPSLPVRGAFFYPWFPEAWSQSGMNPFTHYHPSLGFYDSSSSSVIRNQVQAMQYAKIDVGISSWWGQGTKTNARMPALLSTTDAMNSSFRWSVYYEGEGQGDPSVAQLTTDLAYIRDNYGGGPSYFRVNGRFVVFVYADPADACAMADRWQQANALIGAYVVLKVFPGYRGCPSQPEGWHQYAPAVAQSSQSGQSFAISPGFWKANEAAPRLARDLTRWNTNVRDMVASKAPFQLVATFDEWGEGTSVESASEWASGSGHGAYLDALHTDGQ